MDDKKGYLVVDNSSKGQKVKNATKVTKTLRFTKCLMSVLYS